MTYLTVKEKEGQVFEQLKTEFNYKAPLASPKLVKVIISTGTGTGMKKDQKRNDLVLDRLSKILGQKAVTRGAKQSIASFKIRQGDPVGVMATLRRARMYAFLEKLFNVALPRTKDFRGINKTAVDNVGNLTIGVKEHTIFPETADEDIKDVFGLAITVVSTTKSKKEGLAFFSLLGAPFKKEEEKKKKQ